MRIFHGRRTDAGVVVRIESGPGSSSDLDPRLDLRNHSPTGFEFGYGESGPAQLALAICASVLGDDRRAERVYQAFKARAIAPIRADEWWLDEAAVRAEIERIEKEMQR